MKIFGHRNAEFTESIMTDISDLSQLFIEVRGVDQCPFLNFTVKEIFIPGYEKRSQKLLHFNGHIHGHWNDEVEEHHEGQEVGEHVKVLLVKKTKRHIIYLHIYREIYIHTVFICIERERVSCGLHHFLHNLSNSKKPFCSPRRHCLYLQQK